MGLKVMFDQKEYNRKYQLDYYYKNKEKIKLRMRKKYSEDAEYKKRKDASAKEWRNKLRIECLTHYGGNPPKCICCGETIIGFLTIDHPNNDGAKQRKNLRLIGGWRFYQWLKSHNYPKGYQVMCYNCNCGRAKNNNICPHKEREVFEDSNSS